jgi:DNA-binding MarR family transcriptional regulator
MSKRAPTDNGLAHQVWGLLLNVQARLTRSADADESAAGLLPTDWYDVLLTLSRAPGRRLRLSELADRIVFSRSGLTRLVDRIEREGLLRRERCEDDRRGAFAVLTDAGREALRRSWPIYKKQIDQRFARYLSPAEAEAMRVGLAKVLAGNGWSTADKCQPLQLTAGNWPGTRD